MAGALGYRFSGGRRRGPEELRTFGALSDMAGSLAVSDLESQSGHPVSPCSPLAGWTGMIAP